MKIKSSRPNKINTTLTKDQEDMILFERKQYKKALNEILFIFKGRIPGLYPIEDLPVLKKIQFGCASKWGVSTKYT